MNEAETHPGGAEAPVPENWTRLGKEHLPPATFWPAGFALGITFVFWGLITSWVVLAVGLVMFTGCLAGWISEIRHERKVNF